MSDQIIKDDLMFVSIVGTQALGTLEPLLGLRAKKGPMPIRLLCTNGDMDKVANRLITYIQEQNLGDATTIRVGFNPAGENSVAKIMTGLGEEAKAAGRRICFNLDGGMNYLIAASILELDKQGALTIQSTKNRLVLTDLRDGAHYALGLSVALQPALILKLQGVPFEANLKNNPDQYDYPFSKVIQQEKLSWPKNALQNVKIDNMVFDYVWNPGNNRLCFLKDWRFPTFGKDERRIRERDFAQWSKDRTRCGDLYDRDIFAVVQGKKSLQRLWEDSNGQIEPIHYKGPQKGKSKASPQSISRLREIFTPAHPNIEEGQLGLPPASDLPPLKDNTLVVAVGTDLNTTLLAICSHKPTHVLLVFSRDNPLVPQYSERIRQFAGVFGVKTVSFANFELEGIYASHVLPAVEAGARIIVNISPGTKGQGAMLARWARRNGFEVWSIHNSRYACSPLLAPSETQPIPLKGCDPAILFRLLGRELLSEGKSAKKLKQDFEWLDSLLGFMAQLDNEGKEFPPEFKKDIKHHDAELRKTESGQWSLRFGGREHLFEKEDKGVWFEKLCARALMNAGAEHVRLNLALKWNEENAKNIERLTGEKASHRLEFDVLGSYRGKLVLISAKSYDLRPKETRGDCVSLGHAVQDARNTSQTLDKFTLSIVSHMGSTKESSDDRVALLTWRDICHPEKFADKIEKLSRKRAKTNTEA